jgi:hypothetical protein
VLRQPLPLLPAVRIAVESPRTLIAVCFDCPVCLLQENEALKQRIVELEAEVSVLRGGRSGGVTVPAPQTGTRALARPSPSPLRDAAGALGNSG